MNFFGINLGGGEVEKRAQVFYNDSDNSVVHRILPIEMAHFVKDDLVKSQRAAYFHQFKSEYYFPGYKGIPAGMVTPGYGRDVVLQIHPILKEKELPSKDGKLDKGPIKNIATNRIEDLNRDVQVGMVSNKIINTLMAVIVLFALALGVKVAF